jgi:predicted transcriptional regulator
MPEGMDSGSKALTVRLSGAEYERLRTHAFATRKSHQAILVEALRRYLDGATSE